MARIEIDVDIEEFDFDDILIELKQRLRSKSIYSEYELNHLKDVMKKIQKIPDIAKIFPADNLADEMKREYVNEVYEKYTEQQIRSAIGFWEFSGKPDTY